LNILITGISGFVGKSLVDYWQGKENIHLFGASRSPDRCTALFNGKIKAFTAKPSTQFLNTHHIDVVIHLAGIAHDMSGQYRTDDYFRVNHEQTKLWVDAFNASSAATFVFMSSIKAVVDYTSFPVDEHVKANPVTAYGRSKLQAERYILDSQIESKNYFVLRPCMIYGPGNKGNLNILYRFIKKGIPYPFGAFHNKRSFLYIENLNYIFDQILINTVPGGVYHLADGQGLSTRELVQIIGEAIGKRPAIWHLPTSWIRGMARIGDMLGLFFNNHTLNKLTENMEVSNGKITAALESPLPHQSRSALIKTIKSF